MAGCGGSRGVGRSEGRGEQREQAVRSRRRACRLIVFGETGSMVLYYVCHCITTASRLLGLANFDAGGADK